MLEAIGRRAFFAFEFPIRRVGRVPVIDGDVSKWQRKHGLPALVEMEGADPFAEVFCAWHESGLIAAFDVRSGGSPPHCDTQQWWKQDGVRLCVDTRDARDIKRATRFCHLYYFLPVGGGPRRQGPVVGLHKMSRAKEPPPKVDLALVKAASRLSRTGYALEAFIPGACLNGWDPAEHARIGLFYKVKDTRRGAQHLTADDELGWNVDPSTWATAVLAK